jgi:hypothetical protein
VQRSALRGREFQVDLASRLGKTQVVTNSTPLNQQASQEHQHVLAHGMVRSVDMSCIYPHALRCIYQCAHSAPSAYDHCVRATAGRLLLPSVRLHLAGLAVLSGSHVRTCCFAVYFEVTICATHAHAQCRLNAITTMLLPTV